VRRLDGAAWIAAATLSLACTQPAPPPASGKGVLEADALRLIARYDAAWVARDVAAVERFLAPEYVYFSSRGKVSDLAQMRAMLSSQGYRLDRSRRDELHAYRHGSTVVVGSHWTGAGVYGGKPFTDDQRCSIVVAFADGVGRVLSEHCTAIVPE
jgi:Domain of unknown function (DUF4440)